MLDGCPVVQPTSSVYRKVTCYGDVRQSIKLANFCVCGLGARENWPIESLNYDTQLILSFLNLYNIS